MNLDDLKREILSRVPEKDHYTAHWIIDYLHDQGRIVPDCHVAVPLEPTYEMKNSGVDVDSYRLGDISPLGFRFSPQTLMERIYKAMIAAVQKAGE